MDNEAPTNMNALLKLPECDRLNAAGNPVWALDSTVPTFVEADLSFNTGSERGAVRIHKFGADPETIDDMNEAEALGLALVAAARSVRELQG
ncbi:hypothetical protein G9444_6306 [Rhodococcus erythropolis]|jgi:hypothetical protein|uniref:Uncharacterized protein n=1 Tax=Rhodococcus erythropolis TaxID=1833 RepID=A0A6G9D2Y5_RHOER|nr:MULTISPECIES: hypothetical protein [Rhodococcus]MCJ0897735.1 hypothetical protein [Rhodococcus sp. ARC_M13]QIP43549.1 hypothetical protein G9444_6306 [Rhodococcus erythropolis]UKO86542.1 hypothetical protein ITJ47_31395 [Rhodococcus erythropolis]BBE48933.1 hypothetical protein RE2895_58640 [Rhodococcus erythropolis]